MDRERVEQITRLLKSSAAAEIAVREGDSYIRVSRGRAAEPAAATELVSAVGQPAAAGKSAPKAELVNITSRLVGFFYRGKGFEQPPMLEVGAKVKEGQTVAFIEALRKLTEVVSPVAGEISEVVAESGQAVQFGDVLVRILPDETPKTGK